MPLALDVPFFPANRLEAAMVALLLFVALALALAAEASIAVGDSEYEAADDGESGLGLIQCSMMPSNVFYLYIYFCICIH